MNVYMALVHYPVLNRKGEVIAAAITNLDLHDLARLACTYGLRACYIVTPLKDQQELARRLVRHWCEGVGGQLVPNRALALQRLRIRESIEGVKQEIFVECGRLPLVWGTSARIRGECVKPLRARQEAEEKKTPTLILFGTGWGLAPEVLETADGVLEPITGCNGYNHLSVRCAAAILLDRFFQGITLR